MNDLINVICTVLQYEEDFVNTEEYAKTLLKRLRNTQPKEYFELVCGTHPKCTEYPKVHKKVGELIEKELQGRK